MSDEMEPELREIVEIQVKKRRSAIEDTLGAVLISALAWAGWVLIQPVISVMPVQFIAILTLVLAGFTVMMGVYAVWQLYEAFIQPRLNASLERSVAQEMQRIQADRLLEKPKRSRNRLELAEDGELVEIVDDRVDEAAELRRR